MPSAHTVAIMSRRDSWPPTQLRVGRSTSGKNFPQLLENIDEDPLTYFLTPAPGPEDDDDDDDLEEHIGDFDAGIEDATQPREIVRSVSPSTLDGLSKPSKHRPASPDFDSDVPTSDEEDDDEINGDGDEDYVRFSPRANFELLALRDLAIDSLRYRPRSPVVGRNVSALLTPSSHSLSSSPPRGRSQARGSGGHRGPGGARSLSARTRPNRLWREPSPDVWSIKEETEEEMMMSDAGSDAEEGSAIGVAVAKLKKKVRFVLPASL